MSNINKFTEEDIQTLQQLWSDNLTAKEIAMQMERPYLNVRNKIRDLQKKGALKKREKSNAMPDMFVETTAGVYGLPVDLVQHFTTLFSGGQDRVISGVNQCCMAYLDQNGYCYYLKDRVKLTPDESPSGLTPLQGANGELVLTCRAIAHTRSTMSHNAFINLCKAIASEF